MNLYKVLKPLADRVLTQDTLLRSRLQFWLTSAVTYALYAVILVAHVALGLAEFKPVLVGVFIATALNTFFYIGVRMRWDHFLSDDRGMARTQLGAGLVMMLLTYSIVGLGAGATIVIMASHLIYALFSFGSTQVWRFLALSLTSLALTMGFCHWRDPVNYPANLQVSSFMYATMVLSLIARLATHMTTMTARIRQQRADLAAALEKLQELATRDELTQVHNRRHMVDCMRIEQLQHERTGAPLCLALIDLDLFKNVNDRHGHRAGDEVLRKFATTAKAALRSADLLGRWGGEEFIVMFTNTPLEQAQIALQRLREQLAAITFDDIAPGLKVTFSAGLMQLDVQVRLESSIESVDQAMYRAKTAGRDRVELTGQPTTARLAALAD